MIRIIGVQRSSEPEKEFVLLQNQGGLRLSLKGHILASEDAFENGDLSVGTHAFTDEAYITPGMYVILFSGSGAPKWAKTKEGQPVYYAYMNRDRSVWNRAEGSLHILAKQHSYQEKAVRLPRVGVAI